MQVRPSTGSAGAAAASIPSVARRIVVLFAVLISWITFLDRAALGQAAPLIMRELHLSTVQMSYVFSAFGLAYAAFEIPGGMYCDRKGPRKALTRIVIWWSVFTMATGWAWGLVSLWAVRFLFGAGEAGCYPALAKMFQTWLPQRERAMAEGMKTASSRLGAAMAPYLVVMLTGSFHWRGAFLALGSVGFLWAGVFYWWFRDRPAEHPAVNTAELAMLPRAPESRRHQAAPWGRLLGSRSLWLLGLQWFCHFYTFYFYITWLPTYLQEVRGVDVRRSAVLAGLPVLTAAVGSLAGGWMLAHLIGHLGDIRLARKLTAYFSFTAAALVMILAIRATAPDTTVWLMSVSSFFAECSAPLTWTTAMDLGGRHVGAASGVMNTMGQLGGAVAPVIVGYLVQAQIGGWTAALYSAAAIYMVGFFCWLLLDPVTPLEQPQPV